MKLSISGSEEIVLLIGIRFPLISVGDEVVCKLFLQANMDNNSSKKEQNLIVIIKGFIKRAQI